MVNGSSSQNKERGAATLVMTLVLLMVSTFIILFAANIGVMYDKATYNYWRNIQAFDAAQAGLEYGINYLNKFSASIINTPISGFIPTYTDSNISNVILPNRSRYTVYYTNPIAYDYKLILVQSTGTSDDGTASRTVSQLVQFGSVLNKTPANPLLTKSSVSLGDNSSITNQYGNITIDAGSSVVLSGSANTVLSSGVSSTASSMGSDIIQNDNTINSLSSDDFYSTYFGLQPTLSSASFASYYSNSSDTRYRSSIHGAYSTSIWINQTGGNAIINGSIFGFPTIVGSSSNPVLMVVNGNTTFTGTVIFYGFLYTNGNNTLSAGSNVQINGGMMTTGSISGAGALQIFYSPTILSTLQATQGMQYYAKVPGSWKDF